MARIGIVGCGPGGLAAALLADRQGHDVTLLERFDEPRPVGSGLILQPTGLAVLRELGLCDRIAESGSRINRLHGLSMPAGKTVLDVDYSALGKDYHGIAVHRAALFDVLHQAVTHAGIPVRTSCPVDELRPLADGGRRILTNGEAVGDFDLVVDASGARSLLRRYANDLAAQRQLAYGALWGTFDWTGEPFQPDQLQQRYVRAHTMIGVLPVGRIPGDEQQKLTFFWSLKTAGYERWLELGLDRWKDEVLSIWPETSAILEQLTDPAQLTLAHYAHYTMRKPFAPGLAFIGDAAHSTSPQLGQGANMALLDAWVLGLALQEASIRQVPQWYARHRRLHIRLFQAASLALTPFYQSDNSLLSGVRDLLFVPLSKAPLVRRIVAGLVSGLLPGRPRKLDFRPDPKP